MDATRILGPGDDFEIDDQSVQQTHNPLKTLHLLLQGRYWIAVTLALVLGAVGAVIGFKSGTVAYICTGSIHIKPYVVVPLVDKNGMMPMYESYVYYQVGLLKSQRLVANAVSSPRWVDAGGKSRSNSPAAIDAFRRKLNVFRDGEVVYVQYTDEDGPTTADAVYALVDAYKGNSELSANDPSSQAAGIKVQKERLEAELRNRENEIISIASPESPRSVKLEYEAQLEDVNILKRAWDAAKSDLEQYQRIQEAAATQDAASTQASTSAVLNPDDIAARGDSTMRDYLKSRDQIQAQIRTLLKGVGPNNLVVRSLQNQLDELQAQIETYAKEWNSRPRLAASNSYAADAMQDLEAKRLREQSLQAQYETAHAKLMQLGNIVDRIHKIEDEMQDPKDMLERAQKQLRELEIAANQQGYVEILSYGDTPERKDRRIPVAAASGFAGLVVGFGAVLLWGLMDRRLRSIDQARMQLQQGMRVLGMLPSLPKNLEDPSAASFAALCVHHIRMLLQVMPRLDGRPVIAVTSPSPGDGKTSLTLALALSFAASGKSTLLIDCDMAGAGLTRRVNAIIRRRIGQILIREQLITPAELREALGTAQRTGRRLGEVLVDEGYVDAEQLAKALKVQGESPVGLMDVMRGEVLEDCVADTGTARLWILPMGSAQAEHAAAISPEGFRAVLEQARKRFEVVLVDTGPIPGSIESSVAVSQADGVVMCVSRGEQGPLVRRASEHMRDVGARALGIVFNRATPEDFSSSYGSMSSPSIPERVREKSGTDTTQFGPVAAAVAGKPNRIESESKE